MTLPPFYFPSFRRFSSVLLPAPLVNSAGGAFIAHARSAPLTRPMHPPVIAGTMLICDATAALTNSGLPSILVACKCDAADSARQIDADSMANQDIFRTCVANYNISSNRPEHSRACLNAIIRTVISNRRGESTVRQTRHMPPLNSPSCATEGAAAQTGKHTHRQHSTHSPIPHTHTAS